MVVNPTMSAKSTVTTRRSSPTTAMGAPQEEQKRAPGSLTAPHDGQVMHGVYGPGRRSQHSKTGLTRQKPSPAGLATGPVVMRVHASPGWVGSDFAVLPAPSPQEHSQ